MRSLAGAGFMVAAFALAAGSRASPPVQQSLGFPPSATLDARLDAIARRTLRRYRVPGLSLAIARGELTIARAYGMADVASRRPLSPRGVFPVGSITKMVKAAVAMKLVEQRRLRLDTPLAELLPGLPPDLLLAHLLHQTSGLPHLPDDVDSLAKLAGALDHTPMRSAPGSRWNYNNANYDVLDDVFRNAAGVSLATLVDDRMMLPAGLGRIGTCDRVAPTVTGYILEDGKRVPVEETFGICATAEDLARFGQLLGAGALVSADSFAVMTQPAVLTGGERIPYGFGLDLRPYRGHRRFWHTGHLGGYVASLGIYPDDDLTVAVLANFRSFPYPEDVELAVARAVLDLPEPEPKDLAVEPALLSRILGTYDAGDVLCRIRTRHGRLVMELIPDANADPYLSTPLLYQGQGRFVSEDAPDAVTAAFDVSRPDITFAECDMVGVRWRGLRLKDQQALPPTP